MKDFLEKLEFNFFNELETLQAQGNNINSALTICRAYLADLKKKLLIGDSTKLLGKKSPDFHLNFSSGE